MTTGTKVFLALFALIVGVLVVYYGVAMPNNAPPGNKDDEKIAAVDSISNATGKEPDAVAGNLAKGVAGGDHPSRPPADNRTSPPPREPAPTAILSFSPPPANVNANGGLLTQGVNEAGGTPPAIGGSSESRSGGVAPAQPSDASRTQSGTYLPLVGLNNGGARSNESPASKGDAAPPAKPDEPPPAEPAKQQPPAPTKSQPANEEREPSPQTARAPARIEYVISEGDTFVSIADEWFGDDTKWSLIARENPTVDPQKLKIGQRIFLPPKEAGSTPIERDPVLADGERLYVVQAGDTLIAIARDELNDQTRWEDIYALNKATIGANSAALKVGMKLKLPKSSK